jgi:hypothetical protein
MLYVKEDITNLTENKISFDINYEKLGVYLREVRKKSLLIFSFYRAEFCTETGRTWTHIGRLG